MMNRSFFNLEIFSMRVIPISQLQRFWVSFCNSN
jgi:hypothetical protein